MADGAQIKFRENAVTSVQRDATGISIHVRGIPQGIRLNYADCSDAVLTEAKGYGLEVRLTRAAAIEVAKAGRKPTAQEKYNAIKRLADHYASGTESWGMGNLGGGGLSSDTRALIEAIVTAFDADLESTEEAVRNMTSGERDALRVDPEIKRELDKVYEARAAGGGGKAKELLEKLRRG